MIVTMFAVEDVNSFSPWGTVKLFGIFAVFSSCWKSLSFALKSSLFLLCLLCGGFGGVEGAGEFSWGFFLVNLFLLDVARPLWVRSWILPSTFMNILCFV